MTDKETQTAGRQRQRSDPKRIQTRVAKAIADVVLHPEGVQPLNAGFFLLEKMRLSRNPATKQPKKAIREG